MSQGSKSAYYQALKGAGVELAKHYRDYKTDELAALAADHGVQVTVERSADAAPERPSELAEVTAQISGLSEVVGKLAQLMLADRQQPAIPQDFGAQPGGQPHSQFEKIPEQGQPANATAALDRAKANGLDPQQHAGVMLNQKAEGEVLFVDENGVEWYQTEVTKPGHPKPRGRRIYRDIDTGVKTETITTPDGYTETFEIPGDPNHRRPLEIKVTLPSYQVGIFKAPGMPFKIHTYQGARAFDRDDVNAFYGGADLVPDTIKRVYVSNDLCYDITTTIRAVQDEYRERVLKKESIR